MFIVHYISNGVNDVIDLMDHYWLSVCLEKESNWIQVYKRVGVPKPVAVCSWTAILFHDEFLHRYSHNHHRWWTIFQTMQTSLQVSKQFTSSPTFVNKQTNRIINSGRVEREIIEDMKKVNSTGSSINRRHSMNNVPMTMRSIGRSNTAPLPNNESPDFYQDRSIKHWISWRPPHLLFFFIGRSLPQSFNDIGTTRFRRSETLHYIAKLFIASRYEAEQLDFGYLWWRGMGNLGQL